MHRCIVRSAGFALVLMFAMTLLPVGVPLVSETAVVAAQTTSAILGTSGAWVSNSRPFNTSMAWGDVDNDGDLDFALGTGYDPDNPASTDKPIILYRNQGNGDFIGQELEVTVSPFYIWDLAWGDVDNDGDLDLAFANAKGGSGWSGIYVNEGGNFSAATWLSLPYTFAAWAVAWGDMNGDGYLDLAMGGCTGGRYNPSGFLKVFLNGPNGLPTIQTHPTGVLDLTSYGPNPQACVNSLAWGDLDGTGYLDLAVGYGNSAYVNSAGDSSNGGLRVLKGNLSGAPGFSTPAIPLYMTSSPVLQSDITVRVRDLAWADLDGDGDLDLAAGVENEAATVRPAVVYLNSGGTFAANPSWEVTPTGSGRSLTLGDVDNDGDIDLAVTHSDQDHVYLNTGSGLETTAAWSAISGTSTAQAWADYDGDGRLDLATAGANRQMVIYANRGSSFQRDGDPAIWTPAGENSSGSALAWGDLEGDGDLDLAVSGYRTALRLHRNCTVKQTGDGCTSGDQSLQQTAVFSTTAEDWYPGAEHMAWGDVDGDGDQDLLQTLTGYGLRLYRNCTRKQANDGCGDATIFSATPAWAASTGGKPVSIAWGDVDNDGDLDLALANDERDSRNRLYRNEGGTLTLDPTWNPLPGKSRAVAWGDVDRDGDLDLAFGANRGSLLYLNDGGTLQDTPAWTPEGDDDSLAITWGDVDGDGDLDLVTGSWGISSKLYLNHNGILATTPGWQSGDNLVTRDLGFGDADGDGDLDLAVTSTSSVARIYFNEGGQLQTAEDALWSSQSVDGYRLAWGDIDGNGALDPAFAGYPLRVYRNLRNGAPYAAGNSALRTRQSAPQIRAGQPTGTAGANFYAQSIISSSPLISIPYQLVDQAGRPAGSISAEFSLDGGDNWQPAVTAAGTATLNRASSPSGVEHTFVWDVAKSGIFGQSDNVVLRLIATPAYSATPAAGTIWNSLAGSYRYAASTAVTYPFRVRGKQVRVLKPNGDPAPDALVFRRTAGQSIAAAIARTDGAAFHTDQAGYLAGRGELADGDELIALFPLEQTEKFTRYLTSAPVTANGPAFYPIAGTGVQTLQVSQNNPLLAINLVISLEWDARNDAVYLEQLTSDLRRTSELLYIWSSGQIALGDVSIFHDKVNWATADVQIHAGNSLRPNANQGGIVRVDTPDPSNAGIVYEPGQIRIGAVWTRFGEATGQGGEDWPRAMAHELGHWALFLDEDYLGFDANKRLITVEGCAGPMADPYRNDYGRFRATTPTACEPTLNQQLSKRSNWATIKSFYDKPALNWALTAPESFNPNSGPSFLPFNMTVIHEVRPNTASDDLLAVPIFNLQREDGTRYVTGGGAKAMLFAADGSRITDLGTPERGEVHARGARSGDRLCVFDLDEAYLGCEALSTGDNQLTMIEKPGWQPELLVTPVTSSTYQLRVDNLPDGLNLQAKLYSSEGAPSPVVTLTRNGASYLASVELIEPILAGALQVWVEETGTRREVVTDYALGGNPAPPRKPKKRKNRNAPALSPDGQVVLFSDNLTFNPGSYFAIQSLTSLPLPAPAWSVPVGYGYRLLASANAPSLTGTSLNMSYLESDIVPGTESGIGMYYMPEGGSEWQRLSTRIDLRVNEVSAAAQGPGTYILMSSIRMRVGWNMLSYPWPEPTVAISAGIDLLGGNNAYSTIYWYDPTDAEDPWKVYDIDSPQFANDLTHFEYGQGYWLRVTTGAVIATPARTAETAQVLPPERPSSYFGSVAAVTGGQTVEAWIGSVRCATTSTRFSGNKIGFLLDVPAASEQTGCGVRGALVEIRVEDEVLGTALWTAERPQRVGVDANPIRMLYLPIMNR